jgi:hypothetical protein
MSTESPNSLIRIDVHYWVGTINDDTTMEYVLPHKVTNRSTAGNSIFYVVHVDVTSPNNRSSVFCSVRYNAISELCVGV